MKAEKEKSEYRKQVLIFLIVSICVLAIVAGVVIYDDPFFQYHDRRDGLYYQIDNKVSQNPGMVKHFQFDNIITGSSMTANFDSSLFDEFNGGTTLKLTYDSAYPKDMDNLMKMVVKSGKTIQNVYMNIDIFTYAGEPGETAYENPMYLYDDNVWNDVSYVWNKDVLLQYVMLPQVEKESTPLNEIYNFWQYMGFGKGAIALSYSEPDHKYEEDDEKLYEENIHTNMEQYIIPYIEQMSDTQFHIFFAPYSALYWYDCYADGTIGAEIEAKKQIIEMLLSYENVTLYDFQDMFEYTTELAHYCDDIHYNKDGNDYITSCFESREHEITLDNYEEVEDCIYNWAMSCDYKAIWGE